MAFVEALPTDRDRLSRHGFACARDFLNWPGVILSGHPSRHVLRIHLDGELFILKKEHHVPWRDRFASAWAGFGWSSKSVREARALRRLHDAGIPCPEVVAAGEDGTRAFVLLREAVGMTDLRALLARPLGTADRRPLAAALGRELARIHAAGFEQPDLYAKHILVRQRPDGFHFCFLDWQRCRHRPAVSLRRRGRDLAALDASLADDLAPDRLRLACLRAYLAASGWPSGLRRFARPIRRLTGQLLRRRKARELRQPPLPDGTQQLLWLEDRERLCIARAFHEELGGRLPAWFPCDPRPSPDGDRVEHRLVVLEPGRTARLTQRWRRPAGWLARDKFPAPEFALAAAIFRLQRFGVPGPRLLAMGHRPLTPAQHYSFLLTEPPAGVPLPTFLRRADLPTRHRLLRRLGSALRQVHDAGYAIRPHVNLLTAWVVTDVGWVERQRDPGGGDVPPAWVSLRSTHPTGQHVLALADVDQLERATAPWQRLAGAELRRAMTGTAAPLSRTDLLRISLGYCSADRLDANARGLLTGVRPRERQVAR
jgi:heptose I phosphotransferase